MLISFLVVCCLTSVALAPEPALDARESFAKTFYRQYVQRYSLSKQSFVFSPIGLQKFFAVIYSTIQPHFNAEQLSDLHFKKAMTTNELLDYFSADFNELDNQVVMRNFLIAPDELNFVESFPNFADDYFNIDTANLHSMNKIIIERLFGYVNLTGRGLNLLSALELHTQLNHTFVDDSSKLITVGYFRYAEIADGLNPKLEIKVLEMPLEAKRPNRLLLFMSKNNNTFSELMSFITNQDVHGTDFNSMLNIMEMTSVRVTLPIFQFKTQIETANYFSEFTRQHDRCIFSENMELPGMFENAAESVTKVDSFLLKSKVHIIANHLSTVIKGNRTMLQESRSFNAYGKPFFFVIKSDDVIYFMGHSTP